MGKHWIWSLLLLGMAAWSPVLGQVQIMSLGPGETWLDIPVLKQDPNTLKIPPGVRIPQVLSGWTTKDCPSGAYLHMKRWVCLIWFDSLLAAPDHYFGKDVRTQGVIRIGAGGQPYLMPSDDIIEGPERIRIERAASSLPPLKDGEPVFVAGTFGPEDAARAPGLGVLSNAHDVVFSEYGGPDSFLPSLQLKSPKAAEDAPPKFDIAPNARR